jgi:hypothetical protein
MSRDQLERFVKAIEDLILEEGRHSDPSSAHYIRHDLARWFLEAAKRFLNGEVKSLDLALGLLRSVGHPVDPNKSTNFDRAEKALTLQMQGKIWAEINKEVFADRAEPPDERYIRTVVDRYKPLIMEKWRRELHRRWLARSDERKQEAILKNSKKGRTPNSH